MKIAMISSYHYVLGGIERVVFETTQMLRNNGHEVIPFAMHDPRNIPSEYDKYFVDQRDISKISFSVGSLITAAKMIYNRDARIKIRKLIEDVKPDIAHVHHVYGRLSPSVLMELKRYNIPIVMTLHDYKLVCPNYKFYSNDVVCEKCDTHNFYQAILNRCVKKSFVASSVYCLESYLYKIMNTYENTVSRFIAPSKFMKDIMIDHGMNAQKFEQIYNFLNVDSYLPNYNKKKYIVFFGRLTVEKGLFSLLEAIKINRNIELIIVGTGEIEQEMKHIVHRENLTNVVFTGFKAGAELRDLVSYARAVVVPSIWYENNPMVVLESFAYGTPVIGANIGGIPELVYSGDNGFLFSPNDSVEMAMAIQKIVEASDEAIAKMGRSAREFVEKNFCETVHYDKLMKLYNEVIH